MQIANYFFETGLFASAVPDFLTYNDVHCANDTFFMILGVCLILDKMGVLMG